MKTLQEIQDEYAREQGFEDWGTLKEDVWLRESYDKHWGRVMVLVQQEQQKLIANKAKVKRSVSKEKKTFNWIEFEIDKSSILNENNIIK